MYRLVCLDLSVICSKIFQRPSSAISDASSSSRRERRRFRVRDQQMAAAAQAELDSAEQAKIQEAGGGSRRSSKTDKRKSLLNTQDSVDGKSTK